MPYLRSIVGRYGRRAHRHVCTCRRVVFTFEAFCPVCDTANPAFNPLVFHRYAKTAIEQAQLVCHRDVEHALERGEQYPLRHADPQHFCTVCGVALAPES